MRFFLLFIVRQSHSQTTHYGATADTSDRNRRRLDACAIVPKLWYLQVSDTGYYIPRKDVARLLKPGDHIAWLRIPSYYHHAIVVEVGEASISVVEASLTGIHESEKPISTCCCSPLYRVYYPADIETYPSDEVVRRARDRIGRRCWRPWDNCEHFATWCKVDCRQCSQWRQCGFSLLAYTRRPLVSLVHICLVVLFSEVMEEVFSSRDVFGAILLLVMEFIYLIIVLSCLCRDSKRGKHFIARQRIPSIMREECAFAKAFLQSIVMVAMSIVFGVWIKNNLENLWGPWSNVEYFKMEIGLGTLGGILGNMLGFFFFSFIPNQCCLNERLMPRGLRRNSSELIVLAF